MRSVKAVYENGHLVFPETQPPKGRMNVVVTFLEDRGAPEADKNAGKLFVSRWTGIIRDSHIEGWKDHKAERLKEKPG